MRDKSDSKIIKELREKDIELKNKIEELRGKLEIFEERKITAFTIGNAVSDGICIVDSSGIIRDINKGYTKITGLRESDVVGKSVEDIIDKNYFSDDVASEVIRTKRKVSQMSTIQINNKKVLITGNPFFNKEGEVIEVLVVMRDMTELLLLKEKLENAEKEKKTYQNRLELIEKKESKLSGISDEIVSIREQIETVAVTNATVMIIGETGVGKEVVASEIVRFSERSNKPYVRINCAAIPENLLESELFGYEKGAFTGAGNKNKIGLIETAKDGTLLLDEIGEMPMVLQSKLLRVIQEKEFTRVGDTKPKKIDVRIIAATNKNLKEQIDKGNFREDLYYRLNVVPIEVPPLRDRKDDIAVMAYMFLNKYNRQYEKDLEIDEKGIKMLESHRWAGNVRELMNVIERLVIMEKGDKIEVESIGRVLGIILTEDDLNIDNSLSYKKAMENFEKKIIKRVLIKTGSTYKAAKELEISQPTVVRKAKKYKITDW
jgi:PAS domain S-box-containing protein